MSFKLCEQIVTSMARAVVGKRESLELLMVGLLADGHVLIEDVPGLGKTLIAKALAQSIAGIFKRVQFTPDLLPSDVTGYSVYNQQAAEFQFQPGPVVTNVLLADEINRTIPRTQASLLESMEERQVTVDGRTLKLPTPFFVIATQNPIELEGTFPLPEAQLDRFLLRLSLGYPTPEEELVMLERFQREDPLPSIEPVATPEQIVAMQRARRDIEVSPALRQYIVALVTATRQHDALRFGASPRASLALMRAAQALAALRGRGHVLPDDVKLLLRPVLSHRLAVKSSERLRGVSADQVLSQVLETTAVL